MVILKKTSVLVRANKIIDFWGVCFGVVPGGAPSVVPHILLFFLSFFSTLFPLSPFSFSLRPLGCHFFTFFALVYNASSIARGSLFRFACCRKHYKMWFMNKRILSFLWWMEKPDSPHLYLCQNIPLQNIYC